MKTLKLVLVLIGIIYLNNLFSQESIVFDKQYLFDGRNNYIKDFKQTPDGGFICGGSIGFGMFDERFLLFKTDSLGEVDFYKYQDSVSVNSDLWAVDITKTGNYVGFGVTQENPDWHGSGAIVMYDDAGDTLWSKQYAFDSRVLVGEKIEMVFYDGKYTRDNSLIAAGATIDPGIYNAVNPIVVKTNLDGDTLWTWRLFNVDNNIVIESIDETIEGEYIAVGRADSPIISKNKTYAPQRGFIIKLSSSGELINLKEWTDIDFNYFSDVAINSNKELVISGVCFHHPPEYPDDECFAFILKTDSIGETLFYDIIGYGIGMSGLCISVNSFDEIGFVGVYNPPLSQDWEQDVLIRKYSTTGELLWSKNIGEKDVNDWPYAVISTNDTGFAFCGLYSTHTQNFSWIVKVDSLGNGVYNEGWINSVNEEILLSGITIYPNPAQNMIYVFIPFDYKVFKVSVFNLEGKEIKIYNDGTTSLYIGDLSNGIYLLKITANSQTFYQKFTTIRNI